MKKIVQRSLITLLSDSGTHYTIRSFPWIQDFDGVSTIRRDKVQAFRQALADVSWKPDPGEVAEKMLCEHLSCLIPS